MNKDSLHLAAKLKLVGLQDGASKRFNSTGTYWIFCFKKNVYIFLNKETPKYRIFNAIGYKLENTRYKKVTPTSLQEILELRQGKTNHMSARPYTNPGFSS